MKIKDGFVVRELAGQYVVVALGATSKIFNGVIKLNDSAKFIWDKLAVGAEKDDVINALLEEYEGVDRATVEEDFENFVEKLKGANILE